MTQQRKNGGHTREAGRETGSKLKWLMRRSWRGVPRCVALRVSDICFSCAPGDEGALSEGDTESRPWKDSSGAISSLTAANRTVGEAAAAAGFFPSALYA